LRKERGKIFVFPKIKNIIVFFINLFKRALCLFRKRQTSSPVLPVTVADTHSATYTIQENGTGFDTDVGSWDAWGSEFQSQTGADIPNAGNEAPPDSQEMEEKEPDYFADMTPATFKAPKIIVKKKSPTETDLLRTNNQFSNRLAIAENASDGLMLAPPQELEAMDEWDNPIGGEENAWADEENEELDWEVEYALRETRRQELERKKLEQQQRRLQRDVQRGRSHSQSQNQYPQLPTYSH
jgi:hypothetical protein